MSLSLVPISRSIILRAANFPPIWVWNISGENDDNLHAVSPVRNSICPHLYEMQIWKLMSSNNHHTDHIVLANSHNSHDHVPRLASCSGRVATVIEGHGMTTAHQQGPILQLNVEGITAAKKQVVEQLAHNNKVIATLLQETHRTNPDFLAIAGYELCTFTTIATFVSQDASN